ncbi:type II toxin-antitoxin system HicB family antitoxin [Orbaceae bacterium ac157xtp]
MFFTLGIESPKKDNEAYGIVVPALNNDEYSCYSAADSESDIPAMATEAILLTIQDMIASGKYDIKDIQNKHVLYKNDKEYQFCDMWIIIDVDLSGFLGKQKRINITLPDILINRIDNAVKANHSIYKDRSNFLAEAAINELSAHNKAS